MNTSFKDDVVIGGAEIAKELGVTRQTIYSWKETGGVLPFFYLGRRLAVRRSELEKIGRDANANA